MPRYILETKLNINNRLINCKVTGAPGSSHDGAPYILDIKGGPGQAMRPSLHDFFAQHPDGSPEQHWIMFDALGCGESDHPANPDKEYTVENFTHIAACVVEGVAEELQLPHMNLRVVGGSFGGTIALNLPRHRPEWTNPDSPIQLQAIFPLIAPLGLKDFNTIEFLNMLYADDPRLPEYQHALERMHAGDIKDRNDFVANLLAPLAPTYGDAYNTLFMKALLSTLKKSPNVLYKPLKFLDHIKPFKGFADKSFDFLYKFSYEVSNVFFRNRLNGFELEDKFMENAELRNVYDRIVIFAVYGARDLCTSGEKSLTRLRALLPEIGCMLHPGRHHDNYEKIFYLLKIFFSGDIEKFEAVLQDKKIVGKNDVLTIPPSFRERYVACYQNKHQSNTTAIVLSALDNGNNKPHYDVQNEPVIANQIEPVIVAENNNQPVIQPEETNNRRLALR